MTKSKSTKRALLMSALALVMCFSMLIGSTYAWFSDTASTSVNTIQAGTLEVALEYKDADGNWQDAEGQTLNFKDLDSNTYWEPGCTYELPAIRVRNNGNLALQYTIVINGVTGDTGLLKAIEFTANGADITNYSGQLLTKDATSDEIVIKGHMKEEAGNEYQGLTLEGIGITVYATQYTSESDSYNNTYDANAGKKNVGPYDLRVLSGGFATYDETTKTYNIVVNTLSEGSKNDSQGGYYFAGYTVNVEGYGANATVSFDKADGSGVTTWKLADEERDGFITNGVHEQWTRQGRKTAYRYDIDGDGVTDFTVVNDASRAVVESQP